MKISRKSLWITLLLPIQIFVVQLLKRYPEFIEIYYARGIYPIISRFFRIVLGWIPFSVGDLLIISLFVATFYFFIQLLKHKRTLFWRYLFNFTAFLSIMHACFYLFWGFNYFRPTLAQQLKFDKTQYTTTELIKLTNHFVNQSNLYHLKIAKTDTLQPKVSISRNQVYQKSVYAFKKLAETYPQFTYQNPSVKSSVLSLLQSYNGTSGYLNPISGEAQVNYLIPITSYPTTTCHEIAHQIGYAAENEANFIGFLACNNSADDFFVYASYKMALAYCLNELKLRDPKLYPEIIQKINTGILLDYNNSYQFWQQYKNPFEPFVKKGYNAYLKANNQEKGIDSYNYVVDLLVQYYKKEGIL